METTPLLGHTRIALKLEKNFVSLAVVASLLLSLGFILISSRDIVTVLPIDHPQVLLGNRASGDFGFHLLSEITAKPHVAYSPENLLVRKHILDQLSKIEAHYQSLNCTNPNPFRIHHNDPVNLIVNGTKNFFFESNNIILTIQGNSSDTLLVSSHFDSASFSHGASDAGVAIVSMLSTIDALSRKICHKKLSSSLLFNFNNAEEIALLGGKSLLINPLFENVKAFLNLEGNGGEKTILFRSNSINMAKSYLSSSRHPRASVIFQHAVQYFDSETDYIPYYTLADLPGLDFALYDNRYLYHTPMDNIAHVSSKAVQTMSDDLFDSILSLSSSNLSKLEKPPSAKNNLPPPSFTFYDVFGITGWVTKNSAYFATFLILISSIAFFTTIKLGIVYYGMGSQNLWKNTIIPSLESFFHVLLSLVLCLGIVFITGFVRDRVNPAYSYGYTERSLLAVIFLCIACSSTLIVAWKNLREITTPREPPFQYGTLPIVNLDEENEDEVAESPIETNRELVLRKREQRRLSGWLPVGIMILYFSLSVLAVCAYAFKLNIFYIIFYYAFFSAISLGLTISLESAMRNLLKIDIELEVENEWLLAYEEYFWILQIFISSSFPCLLSIDLIQMMASTLPCLVLEGLQGSVVETIFAFIIFLSIAQFLPGLGRTMPRFFSLVFLIFWLVLYLDSFFIFPFNPERPFKFKYKEVINIDSGISFVDMKLSPGLSPNRWMDFLNTKFNHTITSESSIRLHNTSIPDFKLPLKNLIKVKVSWPKAEQAMVKIQGSPNSRACSITLSNPDPFWIDYQSDKWKYQDKSRQIVGEPRPGFQYDKETVILRRDINHFIEIPIMINTKGVDLRIKCFYDSKISSFYETLQKSMPSWSMPHHSLWPVVLEKNVKVYPFIELEDQGV